VNPPQKPHEVPHYVVNVDAGEEKFIKDRRTEILSLELLLHPNEAGHETVEEGVLEGMAPDVLSEDTQDPHQPSFVPGLAGLQCILHGHHCSYGTLTHQTFVHVGRGPGVVDDD